MSIRNGILLFPLASHSNFERQLSYTALPCKHNHPILLTSGPVLGSTVLPYHCIFILVNTDLANIAFLLLHRYLHRSLDFATWPAKPKALTPLPFADPGPSAGQVHTFSAHARAAALGPPPGLPAAQASVPRPLPRGRPAHARPAGSGGITRLHCLQTTDTAR